MYSLYRCSRPNFYPRSPCGERRKLHDAASLLADISIHALLAESDGQGPAEQDVTVYFYPRSPCGERQEAAEIVRNKKIFLSTLSLRRATDARRLSGAFR